MENPQAICSRCGQALKYVYYYQGKPVGGDCFERLHGIPMRNLQHYIYDRVIDLESYLRDYSLDHDEYLRILMHQQIDANLIRRSNEWLLLELYDCRSSDFVDSIGAELHGGMHFMHLPDRAKVILCDIIARGYGRYNSKAYNKKFVEVERKMFGFV